MLYFNDNLNIDYKREAALILTEVYKILKQEKILLANTLFILSAQPGAVHKEDEKIPSFVPSLCSLRLQETRPAAGRNVAGAEKRFHFQQKGIRKMGGMEK